MIAWQILGDSDVGVSPYEWYRSGLQMIPIEAATSKPDSIPWCHSWLPKPPHPLRSHSLAAPSQTSIWIQCQTHCQEAGKESFTEAAGQMDGYISWAKEYPHQVIGAPQLIWAVLVIGSESYSFFFGPNLKPSWLFRASWKYHWCWNHGHAAESSGKHLIMIIHVVHRNEMYIFADNYVLFLWHWNMSVQPTKKKLADVYQ
jgi:hypothetical protein